MMRSRIAATVTAALLLPLLATCADSSRKIVGGGNPVGSPVVEKAIVILRTQSQNPDPGIRANCIEALQPSTDPRAEDVIEQGLHDPEWVARFAGAMATGKRQTLSLKPQLIHMATADPSGSVQAACVYALRRMGDVANMNILAGTLESRDPATRANTAFVLGLMGDPTALPLLSAHRDERDPRVRFEITAAMARLGDDGAQKVIIAMALSKYAEDEWNAMRVCADLPNEAAAPLLLGLKDAPKETPPEVLPLTIKRQLVAARSLGMKGSTAGLDVAIKYHDDPDPSLRALSALALGEMIRISGLHALAPMLDDKDPGVQRAAAAAIINTWYREEAAK